MPRVKGDNLTSLIFSDHSEHAAREGEWRTAYNRRGQLRRGLGHAFSCRLRSRPRQALPTV